MKQLTDIEIQQAQIRKAFRTAIRLKHSLEADAEIARLLPELDKRMNAAIAAGQPLELSPVDAFTEV